MNNFLRKTAKFPTAQLENLRSGCKEHGIDGKICRKFPHDLFCSSVSYFLLGFVDHAPCGKKLFPV